MVPKVAISTVELSKHREAMKRVSGTVCGILETTCVTTLGNTITILINSIDLGAAIKCWRLGDGTGGKLPLIDLEIDSVSPVLDCLMDQF